MNIGLYDADKTKFPNLALMKLSAWHKTQGDNVQWYGFGKYDKVYASKVFTFGKDSFRFPDGTIYGGTGYDVTKKLPDHIEHTCPDYGLYGIDYSLGFTTRGCNRFCKWCVVHRKEGLTAAHADIDEFLRHKKLVLMDNNPLQIDHGINQMIKISRLGIKVDYNQGLDARIIDKPIAGILASMKWLSPIRMSCDTLANLDHVKRATDYLHKAGAKPKNFFCYVLVNDVEEAHHICTELRGIGVDPYAQPYRDLENKSEPTEKQKKFARWVNHKAIFKSVKWGDYSGYLDK